MVYFFIYTVSKWFSNGPTKQKPKRAKAQITGYLRFRPVVWCKDRVKFRMHEERIAVEKPD